VADCLVTGTLPFTVAAHAQQAESMAAAGATLNLQADPQQMDLTPAAGSKTGSRSVLFSWRTDAPTTGQLTLYPSASPTQTITRTTPLSRVHTLLVEDLSRNTQYTWWVDSASSCSQTTSPQRIFSVGNGIVFAEPEQSHTIPHDYNQEIQIAVKNEDLSRAHTLRLLLENPYDDLIANFVGPGSIDDGQDYLTLAPGASRSVTMTVHAQDAQADYYDLTARLIANEGTSDEIVDYAHLSLRVLKANQFTMTLVSEDPDTLVKTYRVTNQGLPLTDLNVQALDPVTGLPARALIQPTINHARLATDESLEFQVIPLFAPEDAIGLEAMLRLPGRSRLASPLLQSTGFDVQVVVSAGGASQALVGAYACQEPEQLYAVTLHNVRLSYTNSDWYCTNRPNIDLNLTTPGSINQADLLGASLSIYFAPLSGAVKPHSMQLHFNPTQIGGFTNTIPLGTYLFEVDPLDVRAASSPVGVVNQVVGIRTQHANGGHYQVTSSSRLDLVLDNFTRYVCAADPQDALDKAQTGTQPNPTQIDIQIQQPAQGTEMDLGETLTLQAQVNDFLVGQIQYPVRATVTYRDKLVGGIPYQEGLTLPYVSSSGDQDTYQVAWTAAYTGDVSITAVVDAVTVADSDTVDVSVQPEPPDLSVKVLDPPDQPDAGQVVQTQAEVTNLSGEVNAMVTVRFEYYRLELTAQEQGASAQLEGQWILQASHDVNQPLQLGPGESTLVTDDFTVPAAGNYQVVVTVDP
jgi:hypothetical protein